MAKQYELTFGRRIGNRAAAMMAKRDKGPAWELTTTGRTSGEKRRVMITPVTVDGTDYLVAPYGAVSWVLNLRDKDRATLKRGKATRRVKATEVEGEEVGMALAKYYKENQKYVADYFDLAPNPTIVDFTRVANRHPVFRIDSPM